MATFSLDIAEEDVGRVLNAISANYNRPEQIQNPDYPVDRDQEIDENGNHTPKGPHSHGQKSSIGTPLKHKRSWNPKTHKLVQTPSGSKVFISW